MPDALQQALDNAAYNAPKGSELHLENLDSIADPSQDEVILDQYDPNRVVIPEPPQYLPRDVAFKPHVYCVNDPEQDGLLFQAIQSVARQVSELTPYIKAVTNLDIVLTDLLHRVNSITTTIDKAAQSMPQEPTLSHRSLEEWPDTTLLNELVNRENDLMPFYFELLKRIGSPELQSLVMSSMQGKNNSMVTLAQLCAAMGSMNTQPQSRPQEPFNDARKLSQEETTSIVQQMSQDPYYQSTVVPKAPYPTRSQTYNPYNAPRPMDGIPPDVYKEMYLGQ